MKIFNLVATTEEQKADQALGLKAMFALWLFLFIGAVVYKLFDITFGKTDDTHAIGLLFFPILILAQNSDCSKYNKETALQDINAKKPILFVEGGDSPIFYFN